MSALKRVGDFTAPKDEATGTELRRQLLQLQSNVASMGDAIAKASQQRLAPSVDGITQDNTVVMAPGSFQKFDTTNGALAASLAKPSPLNAGTFTVVIDVGGGANNLVISAAAGCLVDTASSVTVAAYAALFFCDGVDYWRLV